MLHILIVGLVAGFIARLLSQEPNNPSGFILTIVLGIGGAFPATFVRQALSARWWCFSSGTGWSRAGRSKTSIDDGTAVIPGWSTELGFARVQQFQWPSRQQPTWLDQTRNLEILGCAIAHRSSPFARPGMTGSY